MISPLYSQVTDLFGNVIVMLIIIKLFDLLACMLSLHIDSPCHKNYSILHRGYGNDMNFFSVWKISFILSYSLLWVLIRTA